MIFFKAPKRQRFVNTGKIAKNPDQKGFFLIRI